MVKFAHVLRGVAAVSIGMFTSSAFAGQALDGVWTGKINNSIGVVVRIVDNKVVGYTVKNTPIDVKFSNTSDGAIVFGDPANYIFKLQRSGDATLLAKYRDRDGWSRISLDRAQG